MALPGSFFLTARFCFFYDDVFFLHKLFFNLPHRGHGSLYVNNCWQNRVRALCKVSFCLYCHDTTADMQHDIPGLCIRSGHARSNFQVDLKESKYICFDASLREKYNIVSFTLI